VRIPEPRTGGKSIVIRGSNQGDGASLGGFRFRRSNVVAFLLSFVLFIGVCGFLDSRLSWPSRPTRGRR
jgi:hypothetical protein